MRSKNILSIAAFIVAFSGSVALAGLFMVKTSQPSFITYGISDYSSTCSKGRHNRYQTVLACDITEFINTDKSNGRGRDGKIFSSGIDFRPAFESSTFPKYVEAVEEYVDASSAMNTKFVPRDFQNAWNEHMKTWRDYSDFLNEIKDSSVRKNMEIEALISLDNEYGNEINRTWTEVLRIGRTYGADVY